MNTLLLTADNQLGLEVVRCLHAVGARTHVMASGASPILRLSRLPERYTPIQPADLEGKEYRFIARLHGYCRQFRIDALLPSDLTSTRFLARNRCCLSFVHCFPTVEENLLDRLHDKWEFYRFAVAHGIPTPETALLTAPDRPAALPFGYPVMVKPLAMSSCRGVRRFDAPDRLAAYLAAGGDGARPPLIVQRFVAGQEIDLSVLAHEGRLLAWTIQIRPARSTIQFIRHEAVLEIGRRIVAASGFTGVAHFDLVIDPGTGLPLVLECNPRFWGTLSASLYGGVNFAALGLRMACGEVPAAQEHDVEEVCLTPSEAFNRRVFSPLTRRRLSAASARSLRSVREDPAPYLYYKLSRLGARLSRWRSAGNG